MGAVGAVKGGGGGHSGYSGVCRSVRCASVDQDLLWDGCSKEPNIILGSLVVVIEIHRIEVTRPCFSHAARK